MHIFLRKHRKSQRGTKFKIIFDFFQEKVVGYFFEKK